MDIQSEKFDYLDSVEPNTFKIPCIETMTPPRRNTPKRTDKFIEKDVLELYGENGYVFVTKEDVELLYRFFNSQ